MMTSGIAQRQIERELPISRPYLRKLSRAIGYQFPRAGVEIKGVLCMCAHCGIYFYRPPSKVDRAAKNYCSVPCRNWDQRGPNHPAWKDGAQIRSFSSWVTTQAPYKKWREDVLKRCNNKCVISGRDYDLEAHHIIQKSEQHNMEEVFNPENGIALNTEVHNRLHQLVSEGKDPIVAISLLKNEFISDEANEGEVDRAIGVMEKKKLEDLNNNVE